MNDASLHIPTRGFSLLELLVVLVIAGLLVTLTRPLYEAAVPGARLRTEARGLTAVLRDSASLSIMSGRETRVSVSSEPSRYAVNGHNDVGLTSELRLVGRGETQGDSATIVFYPDGSSNGALIDLHGASGTYRIAVDWLTGQVRLSEHNESEI